MNFDKFVKSCRKPEFVIRSVRSLGPLGPLDPLGFAELPKRLPFGSRIVELSKRLLSGADLPTFFKNFLSDSLRESPQKLDKIERQEAERKRESSPAIGGMDPRPPMKTFAGRLRGDDGFGDFAGQPR